MKDVVKRQRNRVKRYLIIYQRTGQRIILKSTFDDRGKNEAFEFDYFDSESKILNKAIHTFLTFLLGFSLKDIVYNVLDSYICEKNPTWHDWDFEYTWFLTSLYHDCLSGHENRISEIDVNYSLDNFLKHTESAYKCSIYDKSFYTKYDLPVFEPTHSKQLIDNYFKYHIKEMKVIDHGILGGYLQFDKLVKNFKEQYDNAICSASVKNEVFYTQDDEHLLVWRIQHLWHFVFVADAIIAHNIWYIDSNDGKQVEIYNKYGLDFLIVNNEEFGKSKRISLEKSPLLFFLAIIDTIEPIKYFYTLNPKFVLDNVSISYINQEKTIEINANNNIFKIDIKSLKIKIRKEEV